MAAHPTVGVEEEFLLVDPDSGAPIARSREVAQRADELGVDLQLELTSCQVETATEVSSSMADVREQLIRLRSTAARAAADSGARLLAVAVPPTVPHEFPVTDSPRYHRIADRFGMLAREQGICGAHVHVAVPTREAAIRVSNRLRPWLPVLLALTANSAIYRNADSGYASWRRMLWARWPSAGPPPHFDSVDEYDAMVRMLLQSGAMLDEGQVYWDVRPSANFPTIEVRVADVPATVADTVLFAALVRATVMTVLDDERNGAGVPRISAHALDAAYWRSARDGLDGTAIDLAESHAPVPARDLLAGLVDRVSPALAAVGDLDLVREGLTRLDEDGNGAMRQRAAWQRRGEVADVVDAVAEATLAGSGQR
ncbi:putative glutamate--cysteine ligase 2-3 [Mycolicibacterium litorale]|uniref:Putative glutamate--cysteine ligase 2 n=1 Tax=Mycolicibacterium litorale TaxID=758802 RepID=A0A6S6PBM5_9MYCO|nr:glutamate--cysteine ligase [Mycolicibacterium litorale]BCI55121.1 putative glutamate--cysteine ligase 2-3 [Mycolicibacterium litorale]